MPGAFGFGWTANIDLFVDLPIYHAAVVALRLADFLKIWLRNDWNRRYHDSR
jgi:hypothetical protein